MVGEQNAETVPVGVPGHTALLPHPSGLFTAISSFIILIYYQLSALFYPKWGQALPRPLYSHIEAEVLLLLKVVVEDKLADKVGIQGVVDHLGAPKLWGEGRGKRGEGRSPPRTQPHRSCPGTNPGRGLVLRRGWIISVNVEGSLAWMWVAIWAHLTQPGISQERGALGAAAPPAWGCEPPQGPGERGCAHLLPFTAPRALYEEDHHCGERSRAGLPCRAVPCLCPYHAVPLVQPCHPPGSDLEKVSMSSRFLGEGSQA